jgi:RNA polymerase sigma-70 factor (ECF subfamily)
MQPGLAVDVLNGESISDDNVSSAPAAGRASAEDLRLARACARGEASAFEQIYQEHAERMKSIAYNHLGNIADAEDAVQEAFVKVQRGAGSFHGQSSFSTWLYRILINTCYDALRRRKVRPEETEIEALTGLPEEGVHVADDVLRMSLRTVLAKLAPQRRTAFLLYEVEGLSHREIASILGIQENYSKWLLFMARQDLRKLWKTAH